MAFVIANHICKSGNNNIAWRIGQFNKRSSRSCTLSKILSKKILLSKKCKAFQQKMKNCREANIVGNFYSAVDIDLLDIMGRTYAREIIKKITYRLTTSRRRRRRLVGPGISYKNCIIIEALEIISQSKRYNSMNVVLKDKTNNSLISVIEKLKFTQC